MTVTTSDIERLAAKVRAEIDALAACAPAHRDLIASATLASVAGGIFGEKAVPFVLAACSRDRGAKRPAPAA